MIQLSPEAKEKLSPAVNQIKNSLKPFAHALHYCIVWVCWVLTLPITAAGKFLCEHSKNIEPKKPD